MYVGWRWCGRRGLINVEVCGRKQLDGRGMKERYNLGELDIYCEFSDSAIGRFATGHNS